MTRALKGRKYMKKELTNQEYAKRVKKLTPKFSSFSNCWHAFVSGGAICVLGESYVRLHIIKWE